jgi:OOP family OmpA-OmpF porin
VVLILAGCASYEGPIKADRRLCMVLGAGAIGATSGIIANDNENDHNDINWSIAGGAAAGAALGYLLCGKAVPAQPPTARASAEPNSGQAPLTTMLRAVASPEGEIVSYEWDFGDGTKGTGKEVSHTYSAPGDYRAMVTVMDKKGLTTTATAPVRALAKPAPPPPPPPVARKIVLRGVNFAFDSAALTPEAEVILQAAVEALNESPGVRVQVAGHTDSTGPEAYNQGLSERRARSVADYLSANGISASRLTVVGFGEAQPVADNGTRDGRAQNRRTELNVVE